MTEIVLTTDETMRLIGHGYVTLRGAYRTWRLAHESYDGPFPEEAARHVSLSAAEVDIIARMPEGLIVGGVLIRSLIGDPQ